MSEGRVVKSGEKAVKTLCRLSPSRCASASCLKLKNGRNFTVISTGNELIYVLEEHKMERIFNVHSSVVKVLDHLDVNENIWVITKDGKLWAISLAQNVHLEQKDNPLRIDDDMPETNIEIFAELLGNTDVLEKHMTSPSPIVHCSEDNVVHWETGLQDVLVGADHVITCCTKDDAVRISVYPLSISSRDGTDDRLRISPNPLYRTTLTTDMAKNSYTENQREATVLLYLKPSDVTSSACTSSAIGQQFFHKMFQTQVCSNVHMVLLGTDSGMIGYLPVAAGIQDTHVPPEVLYHLEQPVAAMSAVCLSNSDSMKSVRNTLILVGTLGKLVLVMLHDRRQPTARGIEFREYHIPGPVVSFTVNGSGNVFFYSTLKQVYAVPLRYAKESEDREQVENASSSLSVHLPLSLSPILLPFPKVSFLAVEESYAGEMKTESLLCVKTDGRVLLVEQPLAQLEKISFRSHTTAQINSGERIEHYLADIQKKSNCITHLRQEIQQLDNVIKQLNIASHAVCEILRNREQTRASCSSRFSESCNENPGISFLVHVGYEAEGGRSNPRVILRCDLVNSTKFPFSLGWSMVVQVHTKHPWFNEKCEAPQVVSHSISLDSSSMHRISIPLEANSLIYLSPIEVSCFVCFNLKEILPAELKDSHPALAGEGFAVLVRNSKLSILNFLRNIDCTTTTTTTTSVSENHLPSPNQIQVLQQTLRNLDTSLQSFTPSQPSGKLELSTKPELCTTSLHLSKEAVEFIHKCVSKNIAAEKFDKPRSKELSALYFLLFDSRKHLRFDNTASRGNYVHTQVPNEEEVKFQVLRSSQSACDLDNGLEVRMHMSSEALKCSVHSAVLRVLEPVLQRNPEQNPGTGISIGQLQKRLTKLKEVQTSLDLLRRSFLPVQADAELQERSNLRMFEKLINIYNELRKVPTLVP